MVVGARTSAQLRDNLDATWWSPGTEEVARLDAVSAPRIPHPHRQQLREGGRHRYDRRATEEAILVTGGTTIDRVPADAGSGRPDSPTPAVVAPIGAAVAVAAVAAQFLEAAFDVLPNEALTGTVTLGRLLVLAGLIGVVVAGARLQDFRTGLDVPIALLLVAATATTARGGWDGAPLRFLVTVLGTYYLVVATLRVVPTSRAALALLALASVAGVAATGIAQVAEGDFTGFYRDGLEPITSTIERPDLQVRATGTFVNPNLLAAFVALALPIGALAARRMRDPGLRWGAAALGALAIVGLLLTFSRAAVVAVLVGMLVLALVMPQLREARRPALWAAGGLAVVLAIAVLATGGRAIGGFGRPESWRLALDAAAENRVSGVGLGRVGDVMNALGAGDETFAHAHNLWLNWLAEAGPLALVAMSFVAFWLVAEGMRLARAGAVAPAAALAALVAFFLMSVVDHPANSERVSIVFWIVAAGLAADATRRITPGIFTGEPATASGESRAAAPSAHPLDDPVPPRTGPAAGEAVRVIGPVLPAAAAGAGVDPTPPPPAAVEPTPTRAADPTDEAGAPDEPPVDPRATAPMVLPILGMETDAPAAVEPVSPGSAVVPEDPDGSGQPTGDAEPGVTDPAALFARIGAGLAASRDAERGTMMGSPSLRVARRYVAALVDDEALAVRLEPARAATMIDAGRGASFAPDGRPLDGWVAVRGGTESEWRGLIDEAVAAADPGE